MEIITPYEVTYIIDTLETNGFDAYAVGGCVRDSLLGNEPEDWDICTQALPGQVKKAFKGHYIIETGLKHGTVTLILDHKPFEITTYRTDGTYTDYRRPDHVEFVRDLKEDLARRDFTINAMAYNPKTGLVDYFGGQADLGGVIKCVGEAGDRFREDALRIMRALRFASALGFAIETGTAEAMYENKGLLKRISVERIATELNKLLTGPGATSVLRDHMRIIAEVIPELLPMPGFPQNNPHHYCDVWTHTLMSVENIPPEQVLRLTMLLHDIAKPHCYTEEAGIGHFYSHAKLGAETAGKILRRLKYDNNTIDTITCLVLYHDTAITADSKNVKRWLNRIGEQRLRQLLEVKKADTLAQSEKYRQGKLGALGDTVALIDDIIGQRQCFTRNDLAVDGKDIIGLGIREGAAIGKILNTLLEMIINEEVENNKEELLKIATKIAQNHVSEE